jgi:molybdopterin synthase catalytic subunit
MTPEEQIELLKKEVEYWKEQYYKTKEEIDKLSLDLGIKNKDFQCNK